MKQPGSGPDHGRGGERLTLEVEKMPMQIDLGDGTLYVETLGQGPPLVLMHGGLGIDHTCFRPWLDSLGEHFALVYYDHRGNGRSSRPSRAEELTLERLADDADRLREALGHERITLLGHSVGGFIALEYALRHGDRLDGLILASTSPAMPPLDVAVANAQARADEATFAALQQGLAGPTEHDHVTERTWRSILPLYFHRPSAELEERVAGDTRYSALAFDRSTFELGAAFDVRERLGQVRAPTLVVQGDDDWIMPLEHAGRPLYEGIPNVQLVTIEAAGHFPWAERPDAFRDAVLRWAQGALPATLP